MSDRTLSIRDCSSLLKTDACSICLIALFKLEKSCCILYFSLQYAILFPRIEFALLDTYSKHELTKLYQCFSYSKYILNHEYTVYTSCVLTESSKGPTYMYG